MRTLSTAQQGLLEGTAYSVHLRVDVENSTGGFVDLTNLGGVNWVEDIEWGEDIDQPIATALIGLRRDVGTSTGKSLVPLDAASTLNTNSTGGFAALVNPGREIIAYTATLAVGTTPTSTQWQEMFRGEIDKPMWGGRAGTMRLECRDLGGVLEDRWIESEKTYGTSSGKALETVMQELLNDTLGSTALALYVPTSPGFLVTSWPQEVESLFAALRRMADWVGWDVRYRWDNTSTTFRLTLQDPRASTASVYTHAPSRYIDVENIELDRKEVRNKVRVKYFKNGSLLSVTAESTASQDTFGVRFFEIGEPIDSPVDTSTEATALADAVLTDLKDPKADQEIEQHYFWPVMLNDTNTYTQNGIHYDSNQTLAAVSYRHSITHDGKARTRIRARGNPAGAYYRWLSRGTVGAEDSTALTATSLSIDLSQPSSDTMQVDVTSMGADVASWRAWQKLGGWPTTDATTSGEPLDRFLFIDAARSVRTVRDHASTGTWNVVARGYDAQGTPGVLDSTNITISATTSFTGALSNFVAYEVDNRAKHHLAWDCNAAVQAASSGKYWVGIVSSIDGTLVASSDGRDPRLDYLSSTADVTTGSYRQAVSPCNAGEGDCSYVSFDYTLTLYEDVAGTTTSRGVHTQNITNYYLVLL